MKVPVIHIITRLELGGAQQNTLYTLKNLDRRRYIPVLVAGEGGPLMEEAGSIPGLRSFYVKELVREVSPFKDAAALLRLYRVIRRVKAGAGSVIVHTHSSKAGILGRVAAYMAGVPVIVHTVHGFGFNDEQGRLKRRIFVSLEKAVSGLTTRFVAVARDNITKGVREGIFAEGDAVVIRSGIDVAFYGTPPKDIAGVKRGLGLPEGAPIALMVSCLKPQKAPLDYVRVAARVLKDVPDGHFMLAGDGELKPFVEAEVERLGIGGRFHLLGWRRDVRDIIHACDVMVLTSLWEGLPKVLLQAMAAGRPVVATAVDGTPEAVKDGVNGFLARPHDVGYMAEKVALLLSDGGLARSMGEAGRDMVAGFDEDTMLKAIEALYDNLLKEAV